MMCNIYLANIMLGQTFMAANIFRSIMPTAYVTVTMAKQIYCSTLKNILVISVTVGILLHQSGASVFIEFQ